MAKDLKWGFKAKAERIAKSYRTDMGLAETDPLPAKDLAKYLRIPLYSPEEIPGVTDEMMRLLLVEYSDTWSAATITPGGRTIIIFNSSHSLPRIESSVMHEMGHIICEHQPGPFATVRGFPIPLRPHDPACEEEAKCLGACLQLPRDALFSAVRKGMTDEEIAEHFGASLQMVRFRRRITSIDLQLQRMQTA